MGNTEQNGVAFISFFEMHLLLALEGNVYKAFSLLPVI